jgi:hypothetical protein
MIWAACFAATLIALLASHAAQDRAGVRACLAVAGALIVTRAFLWGLPPDWTLTAYGALWVAVGSAVMRAKIAPGLLLVVSGLCYGWAWLAAAPIEPGQLPLILADAAGVAALALIVGGSIRGLVGAGDHMGGNRIRWRAVSRSGLHALAEKAAR